MTTKKSVELTLRDKLSRLTYQDACKLIGEEGAKWIQEGAKYTIDIDRQVRLNEERFELRFFEPDRTVVTIRLEDDARKRLRWECSTSNTACAEVGAAFSVILEDKLALGLSAAPTEELPLECLNEEQLVRRALRERKTRALSEKMSLQSLDPSQPWTDYTLTSAESGKTYRLALRGEQRGQSYCSCPDFRTNTLGTCKHIMNALEKIKRRFPASVRRRPYKCEQLLIHLRYGDHLALRRTCPTGCRNKPSPSSARGAAATSATSTILCGGSSACSGWTRTSSSPPMLRSTSTSNCSRTASRTSRRRFAAIRPNTPCGRRC